MNVRTALFLSLFNLTAVGCIDSPSGASTHFDIGVAAESIPVTAGQLTAGEWRDLDNWDFWTNLIEPQGRQVVVEGNSDWSGDTDWSEMEEKWGYSTLGRVHVSLFDQLGAPAVDVPVQLLDVDGRGVWASRTDVAGTAELFAGLTEQSEGPYSIQAGNGSTAVTVDNVVPGQSEQVELEVESVQPEHVLDLMFVIDTTGSMSDELTYIQAELVDVLERVQGLDAELDIRLSVNFYRDVGDEYVVLPFPFTTDHGQTILSLQQQITAGGGDYPEALHSALSNAVFDHQWSTSAISRLMIPILDAPPHQSAEIIDEVHAATMAAAELGVRIVPVSASGTDKETEFLLRFIDIATSGTYVFLTDHSGIGEDHLEPTVGQFDVEHLNDLLVRVINESATVGL